MAPRVVIADGSRLLREMLGRALARAGIEAVCTDGLGALGDATRTGEARCILIDAESPEGTWQAALRCIRSAPSKTPVPVLLVTGAATRDLVVEAARAGVANVILKCPEIGRVVLDRLRGIGVVGEPGAFEDAAARAGSSLHGHLAAPPDAPAAAPPAASPDPSEQAALAELKGTKPLLSKTYLLDLVDGRVTLRAVSPVARQVLSMAASATTSLEEVARAVKQDPAICVKILRLANSSAYSGGPRIDSAHKAVSRIGLAQIRETVLNLEIVDRFGGLRCGRIRAD